MGHSQSRFSHPKGVRRFMSHARSERPPSTLPASPGPATTDTYRRFRDNRDGRAGVKDHPPESAEEPLAPLPLVMRFVEANEDWKRMSHSVKMLCWAVNSAPTVVWEDQFANDFCAHACLTMACRQLQATQVLLLHSFYSEARILLRTVYESAGIARMLAKEPELADRWLRKRHWFPERQVRDWLDGAFGRGS